MNSTMYYGELSAYISAELHRNPNNARRIKLVMQRASEDYSIYSLCAEAAKVIDQIEDMTGEHLIDWYRTAELYAQGILQSFLMGKMPSVVDMVTLVSESIEISKSEGKYQEFGSGLREVL